MWGVASDSSQVAYSRTDLGLHRSSEKKMHCCASILRFQNIPRVTIDPRVETLTTPKSSSWFYGFGLPDVKDVALRFMVVFLAGQMRVG